VIGVICVIRVAKLFPDNAVALPPFPKTRTPPELTVPGALR
jgi:hypothetical protein